MSEKRKKIILPLVILATGVLVTFGLFSLRRPVPKRPKPLYIPTVSTLSVKASSHRIVVRTQGTVEPRTETNLVAEVAGRIVWTAPSFASGGFFEEGDTLVRIDPREYELAVITARGQVAQARLRLETELAQARIAKEEWKRLGDGDDSPLATRELQVQEARAALASAEAALQRAQLNLERTMILAPYPGRVREKLADLGQYVGPGTPLASIYAVDYVEVRLPIPDEDLPYLDLPPRFAGSPGGQSRPGPELRGPLVYLYADFAGRRQRWIGRIVRMEGEIDPATRMVRVVAQVDEPYGKRGSPHTTPLPVGLFVEAEIQGVELDRAFVLPRIALRPDSSVLVVDSDSRIRFRRVDVYRLDGKDAIVTGGLEDGEKIVVSSLEAVTDGMRVKLQREDRNEEARPSNGSFTSEGASTEAEG